jgi:hypothetical protein
VAPLCKRYQVQRGLLFRQLAINKFIGLYPVVFVTNSWRKIGFKILTFFFSGINLSVKKKDILVESYSKSMKEPKYFPDV